MSHAIPSSVLHEALQVIDERSFSLFGVIAVHSTLLGPAAGGCRIWSYTTRTKQVEDALSLSRGITYKNAMADFPLGDGKAALSIRPGADRRAALRAFGRAVERLGGRYVTAEDVGKITNEIRTIAQETRDASELQVGAGSAAAGGDPSPWTARGVFPSIERALKHRLRRTLADSVVAVRGVGSVGAPLCGMLADAGARLIVSDTDDRRVRMAAVNGAHGCATGNIHSIEGDVFAPRALCGTLNTMTTPDLRARAVCGAAKNQLADDVPGDVLRARGTLHAPDDVVNAGGIISVAGEWLGDGRRSVEERVARIPIRLQSVFDRGAQDDVATQIAASRSVEALLASAGELAA